MEKNIGKIDRIIRFLAGVLLIYFAFVLEDRLIIVLMAGFGAISIAESFTGFCGLYNLFKINTLKG